MAEVKKAWDRTIQGPASVPKVEVAHKRARDIKKRLYSMTESRWSFAVAVQKPSKLFEVVNLFSKDDGSNNRYSGANGVREPQGSDDQGCIAGLWAEGNEHDLVLIGIDFFAECGFGLFKA